MKTVLLAFLVVGASGCSLKKDVDQAKSTMNRMEEKMGRMDETTARLEKETHQMGTGARDALGLGLATAALERLFAAHEPKQKMAEALLFFASLPFQQWRGEGTDTPQLRDKLLNDSVSLFLNQIQSRVSDSLPVEVRFPSDDWLTLANLSVAMSYLSSTQIQHGEEHHFKPISIYDLLVEALKLKARYEAGEVLPEWVGTILDQEQTAIYLMQLRHNYFPIVMAAKVSRLEEKSLWGYLNWNYFRHTSMNKPLEVDLSSMNSKQVAKMMDWLAKIERTRTDLMALGQSLHISAYTARLLRNWQWVRLTAPGAAVTPESIQMQRIDLLNEAHRVLGINSTVR